MIDPNAGVDWVCANQPLVKAALVWLVGVAPVAGALTWWTGFYQKLPGWAQSLLHLAALNVFHIFADPPPPANPGGH